MTPAKRGPGPRRVRAVSVVRYGGLGILAWLAAGGIVYATVAPLVSSIVAVSSGRGTAVNVPVNLLWALIAVVFAAYLAGQGWKFLHAAIDPFALEELQGEMRPRMREFRHSLHLLRKSVLAMAGLAVIVLFVFMAFFGPNVSPFAYVPSLYEQHVPPGMGATFVDNPNAARSATPTTDPRHVGNESLRLGTVLAGNFSDTAASDGVREVLQEATLTRPVYTGGTQNPDVDAGPANWSFAKWESAANVMGAWWGSGGNPGGALSVNATFLAGANVSGFWYQAFTVQGSPPYPSTVSFDYEVPQFGADPGGNVTIAVFVDRSPGNPRFGTEIASYTVTAATGWTSRSVGVPARSLPAEGNYFLKLVARTMDGPGGGNTTVVRFDNAALSWQSTGGQTDGLLDYWQVSQLSNRNPAEFHLDVNLQTSATLDGDAFLIGFATDVAGADPTTGTYTDVIRTGGSANATYNYTFGENASALMRGGSVWLRIRDTDHRVGNVSLDTVSVDEIVVSTAEWVNADDARVRERTCCQFAVSSNVSDLLYLTNISVTIPFLPATITGVGIGVHAYSPEGHTVNVSVSWDRGSTWTGEQTVPFKKQDDGNTWLVSFAVDPRWTIEEANASSVWIRVVHIQGSGGLPAGTVYLDVAKLQVSLLGPTHPWGTNELGEDVLSGILDGTQVDMRIGVIVVTGSLLIGVLLGVFSGYLGRGADEVIMRITDMFLAVPGLILALAFAAVLGRSLDNVLIALMLVSWPGYTRLIRGQVLSVREVTYVEAARAVGSKTRRIVVRHILPNVVSVVIVAATLDLGTIVISTAALSFLGLGASPWDAEWGIMISRGYQYMLSGYWWEYVPPGLAIFLFSLAFNLFGDGLRDILDPRLRR